MTNALGDVLRHLPADPDKLAQAIIADPAPLLAALSDVDVLRVSVRPYNAGGPLSAIAGWERRYVTEWRDIDA